MTTTDALLSELHVGTQGMFAAAGFAEVSRPTVRRVVMRIDFHASSSAGDTEPGGDVRET
jgi:hypothetical protein